LNGPGILITNSEINEGNFENGRLEGQGRKFSADGTVYKGSFQSGVYHDFGVLSFSQAGRYIGGW
jgi:hypothetical protein